MLLPVCFPAGFHSKGSSKKQADTVSISTLGGARIPYLLLEGKEGTTGQRGDHRETVSPIHPLGSEHRWHPELSIYSLKLKLKKHKPYIF